MLALLVYSSPSHHTRFSKTQRSRKQLSRFGQSLLLFATFGLLLAAAAEAKKRKPPTIDELFNPLLDIQLSHWLVGPIAYIATPKEIETYLELVDDSEARAFIEAFWARRAEGTKPFTDTPQEVYDARVIEADKRFSRGAIPGHRSDRGIVWVLFGEPASTDYETPTKVAMPTLERWDYPEDAPAGLTGKAPDREYRFFEQGDRVVLYSGQKIRPDVRRRVQARSGL